MAQQLTPLDRLANVATIAAAQGKGTAELDALAEEVTAALIKSVDGVGDAVSTSDRPPSRHVRVPERHQPRRTGSRFALTASGTGEPLEESDVGELLVASAQEARRGHGTDGELISVAKFDWATYYGDDGEPTIWPTGSAVDNGLVLQIAAEHHVERMRERGALVASGGIPGPPEARYTVPTFGAVNRPLRDALPSVLANRGEISYNMAPTIEDIVVDQAGGMIGYVTAAQDLAGATKTVQEISAPSARTATVEAEVMRAQQGNFADRFTPEWTRAWLRNGQVRFARHAEARRFNDIASASTHMVDTPARFGAWRDLKRCILGLTEELEDRLRDSSLPIRILLPEYVPAMCAADLTAQAPGDQAWDITEDEVRARLNALDPNVTVTFVADGNQAGQRLLATPTGQSPRTPGFDADVDFLAFPEGTWAFLDGGMLDLGIIRDSVLSASNKFQTFYECWETVAQLAPFSYRVTISLCADGASQASSAIGVCSPQGS